MQNQIPDFEKEWRSLTVTNDYMFGRVFSDKKLCKKLIELLLNVKVKRLSMPPEYQKAIKINPESRGVRFDVYTENPENAFDIEMQTTKDKDLPLRMRYYQSAMDTTLIKKGQPFSALKQSYVLFISTVDQFGYGEPVYEIETVVKGHPDYKFDDKRKEVIYNISVHQEIENDSIKSFFKYLKTGKANMEFEKQIDEKLEEIKDDEYWRDNYISIQMWKWDAIREGERRGKTVGMEEGRKEGKEEGREEGFQEGREEGFQEGREQGLQEGRKEGRVTQKDEDEKLLATVTAQKDAEIQRLREQIALLQSK